MTTRYCRDCDKWLPLSEFYVAYHLKGKPVLRNVCKTHYNLRCTYPERYEPRVRSKLLHRSRKSHRRTAFARILERL